MTKFLYVLFGMAAAPFVMEFVNTKLADGNQEKIINVIKGWPAYAVSVILCFVVAVVVCLLPGGWEFSFFNILILTMVIYFGNQFFFNTLIKPLMSHRKA